MRVMATFSPVTDADLARARCDPAFRQKLLQQNLDTLLTGLKKRRGMAGANAEQLREGVKLAVRLAELIQDSPGPGRRP
jgi:hypothetical protein